MTPSVFVILEALPLTASGKVDRLALPKPDRGQSGLNATFQEPRNPTEQLLAEVWAATLGCERVSIHDDFFSLGGHSLLLARIASRIHDVFGVELPLRALFAVPVAEMSSADRKCAFWEECGNRRPGIPSRTQVACHCPMLKSVFGFSIKLKPGARPIIFLVRSVCGAHSMSLR
jgi:hypothetical protein